MKILKFQIFLLLFVCCSGIARAQSKVYFQQWEFAGQNSEKWLKANVPGCIHTDLLANKIIPDPFFGCNEKDLQWIENKNWVYRTKFQVSETLLKNQHIDLVFEGLDTYAEVFLNGKSILLADNMFCRWEVPCKPYLKKGENELQVVFTSAVTEAKQQSQKIAYTLPGEERVFVRKAQYHFGWDWGPRFVTCGIWRPAYLSVWNDIRLNDVQIFQKSLSEEKALLDFIVEIQSEADKETEIKIENARTTQKYYSQKVLLKKGINTFTLPVEIVKPILWWTHDLGDPYLYTFKISVLQEQNIFAEQNIYFGIRSIEVVNEKDQYGESFYFKLNGLPVFIKGANYIPQDNFLPRVTSENYAELIHLAKQSHMNMLRVWGGGIYENDVFYDLCDKNGILVWQDFMFACAMYPGDSSFMENVKNEAVQNIKRLRNHACIALWCGNNEISEGWHNWGWQKQYNYTAADSTEIWNSYLILFESILPELVKTYDTGRFYWPSSPKYGWGRNQSMTDGDSHYWGVWWGKEPFDMYTKKTGRFMSEYGFQALPEFSTWRKISDPKELYLFSETLKCHQKHPTGYETIETYMKREYNVPKNFEDYIYVSQLLQAYGIKTAIEAHRNAKPRCMGTLYWQLNDCWPVVSWSGIDYFQNKKALQYFVAKAYNNILVTLTNNEKIDVRIISDKKEDVRAQLTLKLMDFNGKIRWEQSRALTIKANSNKLIDQISKTMILADKSQHASLVMVAYVTSGSTEISRNLLYFKNPKDLKLENPEISYEIFSSPKGAEIVLTAKRLAKNVFISFENCDGRDIELTDNFFDILPGEKISIFARTTETVEDLKNKIRIKTLYDIQK